jgi:hypothetical protein
MLSISGEPANRPAAIEMTSVDIAIAVGGAVREQLLNLCAVYSLSYALGSAAYIR